MIMSCAAGGVKKVGQHWNRILCMYMYISHCKASGVQNLKLWQCMQGNMGGDLDEDWRDGPIKNLRWGTAHASVPPIFWEVVLSDACESTNWLKERCYPGILFRNRGFSREEGAYMLYITFNRVKTGKIWKILSMTKRRSSEIFGVKIELFS